jgi:molybdopterin molybdotransferase
MTSFESRAADWLSFEDALSRIMAVARPLPSERVELLDALGMALAADVASNVDLPPWDNSAMDGYAVRGEDVSGATPEAPKVLRVQGVVLSGTHQAPAIGPGDAVRIMTGAPVPSGADSVIRVEDTDREETSGQVRIFSDRDANWNVRPRSQDLRRGELAIPRGASLSPGYLSVLSAFGLTHVEVHRKPVVAIVTSGDELVGPEDYAKAAAGQAIPDTNRTALVGLVLAAGCRPRFLGIARDTVSSVRSHLVSGLKDDVLITVGGASMGEADLFKRVLDELGYQPEFWRVRMRPGTPFGFGLLPRTASPRPLPVFGLPGNPASAFVTFEMFVRPFLLRLAGHRKIHRLLLRAIADEPLRSKPVDMHLLRVRLELREGRWHARSTGPQGSGLIQSLGKADGLAILPDGVGVIQEGGAVDVIVVREGPGWLDDPGFGHHER